MTMLKCRYCQTVFSGNNCPACNCPAEHAEAVPPPDAVDLLVDCPDCGLAFSRLRKDGCPQCGCPTKYAIDPSLPAEPAAPAPSPSPLPSSVEPAPERKSAVSSSSSGVECPDCGITFDRQQSACPRCGCPAQYAIEDVPPEQEPKRNVAASGMRVGSPLSYNSAPVNAPAPRRTALYIIIAVAALLGIIPLNDLLQPLHRSYIRQKLYIRQHASSRLNPMLKANEKEFLVDYGDNFRMRFVRIPEGSFLMGSPESEYGRGWDEDQHQVTISKPFYMGAYEVTQAQYRSMVGENPSSFRGDDNPVEQVSWDDAMDFCWIASFKTGLDVRLPTEAEWEYACRAGTTTPFNTNGRSIANQENYNATATYYRNEQKGVRRGATIAVGSFSANAWGLYDMHGNVMEWCSDRWGSYPKEDVTDPKGPERGNYYRMLRGGAWRSNPKSCRSASRFYRDPSVNANDTGFRVCLASTVEFFSDPSVSSPATAPAPAPKAAPAPTPTTAAATKRITLDCGNGVQMELTQIQPGTFMMGLPESEKGTGYDAIQHQVIISKPFYMGVYEVTQAQYSTVMGTNPSKFTGNNNPVENVLWDEAVEFCRKLSIKTGRNVRLPTEEEWEYACRAGTTTLYYYGNSPEGLAQVGNVGDAALTREWEEMAGMPPLIASNDGYGATTAPVGRFKPNAWGLHDMHGNVWEWCSNGLDTVVPQGTAPEWGYKRVMRGGSWMYYPEACRSAYRDALPSKLRPNAGDHGFRIVLDS